MSNGTYRRGNPGGWGSPGGKKPKKRTGIGGVPPVTTGKAGPPTSPKPGTQSGHRSEKATGLGQPPWGTGRKRWRSHPLAEKTKGRKAGPGKQP